MFTETVHIILFLFNYTCDECSKEARCPVPTSFECLFLSCLCLLLFVACLTFEILRFVYVYVTFASSEYRTLILRY